MVARATDSCARFPEINESTGFPTVTNPVVENIKIPGYNVGLMEAEERVANARGWKRGHARRKKGGRALLTTRLIRSILLAFYTETFVSNTDFKKQTFLSQPQQPDTSVCSLFAIRVSISRSLSSLFPLFAEVPGYLLES